MADTKEKTAVSLRDFFERLFQEHAHLHESERKANQLALNNAHSEIDRRLEALNELRSEVTKDRDQFVQRGTFETKIEAMDKEVRILRDEMIGQRGRQAAYGVILGIISIVAPIAITLLLNLRR